MGCIQKLRHLSLAITSCNLYRGFAVVEDGGVGFGMKQLLHHSLGAVARSGMQRGQPTSAHGIDVGHSLNEVWHHGLAIVVSGQNQRSGPIVSRDVHVCL